VEPELLVWAIRGRDVGPFTVTPSVRLLWTHNGTGRPLPSLPPLAAAYLARHRTGLKARRDYDTGPEWTLFRTIPAVARHRVVWADLSARLEAAPISGPQSDRFMPLNSCYLIPLDDSTTALRIAAWLNSTWMRVAAAAVADPAANGFRRFNARVIGSLPLPEAVLTDTALPALAEAGRCGRPDQEALDRRCANLLGLDDDTCRTLADFAHPSRHRR
jgi:hypothetical protein